MERSIKLKELGEFLRRHRDQTLPDATCQWDSRRRAKGLRRSEVASRVGISEQWYTRLEQGRTARVSCQVLLRLAELYALSPAEAEHMFALVGKPPPESVRPEDSAIPTALRRFVDLSPWPTYVVDHHWDVLVWNDGARAMLHDLAAMPLLERNIVLRVFTEPGLRERLNDWEAHARTILAFFRRDFGVSPADPRIQEVIARLEAESEEFREWWPLQEVGDQVSVRLVYKDHGDARHEFDRLAFVPPENPNLRVVIFLPTASADVDRRAERVTAARSR